jgi:hypothetical protein
LARRNDELAAALAVFRICTYRRTAFAGCSAINKPSCFWRNSCGKTEPLAIWSLVLSIVSLFSCGFILGVPGVICGHLALSNLRRNTTFQGRGMAVAGLTIGYVSITLWLILLTPILGGVAISKLGKTTAMAHARSSGRRGDQNAIAVV